MFNIDLIFDLVMKNTILSSFCESIVWHRIYILFEDTYCCSIILPTINIWEYNFLWLDLQLLLVTPFPTLERQELPCLPQPEFTSCWTGDCYIKRKSIDTCWVLGQVVGLTESREQSNIFQNSGRLWVHDSLTLVKPFESLPSCLCMPTIIILWNQTSKLWEDSS